MSLDADRFAQVVIANGGYSNAANLERYLRTMFKGVPLSGKRLLDIGGGTGVLTLWAAYNGASATCLEPVMEGSTEGILETFHAMKESLDSTLDVAMRQVTVQEYLSEWSKDEKPFDVVVMANSINHLDEDSVVHLAEDPRAWASYLAMLREIRGVMAPGGFLIVTDCDRLNLFDRFGLTSPFMPTIEWHKHQSPSLWSRLFQEAGFSRSQVQWSTPNSLGAVGRALLGNRLMAFMTLSHFRMLCTNPVASVGHDASHP